MARGKSTITVKLQGDNRHLKRVLDDSESRVGRFGSAVGAGFKVAGAATAAVGVGAVLAAPKILALGNELETAGIKASTVFGDSLGDVETWSKETAGALGLTSAELTGLAANMGDLLKPMGFTSEQAADMSSEMLDLSGALSAWTGGQQSAAEVAEILSKAMLGEREQLKALGISISEADVQARLAAKGQKELTGEALAMAKAIATQELILEKSTDAQAAWTDGSMDALKAQNESEASMRELRDTLVQAIYPALQAAIPVIQRVAEWIGEHLPGAIATAERIGRRVVEWWETNWPKIQPIVEAVGRAVMTVFNGIKNWVDTNWPAIRDTITSVVEAIRNVINGVMAAIDLIWRNYGEAIKDFTVGLWNAIKDIVGGAIRAVKGVIDAVTALLRGDWSAFWDGLKNIVAGAWEAIKGLVSGAVNGVKAIISTAWISIKATASAVWNSITGVITGAFDRITGAWDSVWQHLSAVINSGPIQAALAPVFAVVNALRSSIEAVISAWNAMKRLIQGGGAIDLSNQGGGIVQTMPRFHSGGWVGNPSGPPREVPAILQQGEFVISRDDVRGMGRNSSAERVMVVHTQAPDWFDPTVDAHIRQVVRDEQQRYAA